MHSYLMRAPGFQPDRQECVCGEAREHTVVRHGRFTGFRYGHAGALGSMPTNRYVNRGTSRESIITDCAILTTDVALLKITCQLCMRFLRTRNQ